MPNYQEPEFEEGEHYTNHCWACTTWSKKEQKEIPTPIDSNECEKCPMCDYAYKCNSCKACACESPNSKIKQKNR